MVKTFTIATGNVDSQNDKIMVGAFMQKGKTLLTYNFDRTKPPLSVVQDIFIEGNKLMATADIPDELNNLYPAIGFDVLKSFNGEDGIRTIIEYMIREVSLCDSPNADASIKTIGEQLK